MQQCSRSLIYLKSPKNDEDEDVHTDPEETIQAFLDRPFYDPDAALQSIKENGSDKNSLEYRFASFVRDDYETAEALLVGGYMATLVLLAQQLVRLLYPPGSH